MQWILKGLAFLLSFVQMWLFGVGYGPKVTTPETPQPPVQTVRSIEGDSALSASVLYAERMANTVQAAYTDTFRRAYGMENTQMRLVHALRGLRKTATLTDTRGNVYVPDSFDAFCTDGDGTHGVNVPTGKARVNTIRLGLYYYECHVRDLEFADTGFVLDKAYHVYGDRLYQQFTLYAKEATTDLSAFGSIVRIPAYTVAALQIRDARGVHANTADMDENTVCYVSFDIKKVGVVGFILPENGGRMTVTKKAGFYEVRQYAPYESGTGVNKYDETGGYALNSVTFGCRIYTDGTHDFAGVDRAAQTERTPCTVTVTDSNAHAVSLGYEPLRGTYAVHTDSLNFNSAWRAPDKHLRISLRAENAGDERQIMLRVTGDSGGLEAAALLDDTGLLSPMRMEVCKNFCGDFGDSEYYTAKDYAYGDSFSPLVLPADGSVSCTVLHLYQNWGQYPLKQLSSIEFHTSYYHLSTGVTESNCIAPYFTGNDGWLLPDFRGRSGEIWSEQPQFNSVGILKFMQYGRGHKTVGSEYTSGRIDSTGLSYADVTLNYAADCGSYTYSLRHLEFPQTDENRTYYTLTVRFDRTISFRNFRKDFDLFYFDGRMVTYEKAGYLDADNEPASVDVREGTQIFTLGSDAPYFSFYQVTPETREQIANHFGSSFGLIVRSCDVVQNGKPADLSTAFRLTADADKTSGVLTLDTDRVTFYPGDTITMNLILLPWGTGLEETDDNVRTVREDSALHPAKATAAIGTVTDDPWLPTVRCADNTAEFTVTGGRNNVAVRVDGFTTPERPRVCRQIGGEWQPVELSSVNGYDGYTAFLNPDGTYGYAFVFEADLQTDATFRVQA